MKTALYKTVRNTVLTWKELCEVVLDIEIALNNRPPRYVEEGIQQPVLTPNSFLFIRSNTLPELAPHHQTYHELRKHAKILTRYKDALWSRWTREYLRSLRERHNLSHAERNSPPAVGDVIIIQPEDRNRAKWPHGIVEELYPGRNGVVRSLKLRAGKSFHSGQYKRAEVIKSLVLDSPNTRASLEKLGIIKTPEEQEAATVGTAVLADVREALEKTKGKRKNDARAAVQVELGYLVGDNVKKQRLKRKVSRSIGISRKSLGKAHKTRKKDLSGEVECWTYTERKTRSDAISAEYRKLAHDFWASTEISQVVPNKNTGIVRKRLAPKTYVSHPRHILEKTQTEAFLEFKRKYPDVKMGQRFFEKCKPFSVFSPTQRDRVSCCCRVHVETRLVFRACMEFRRKFLSLAEQDDFVVFEHLSDMAEQTSCPKQGAEYHAKECLMRQCPNCGVQNLPLMPEEASLSDKVAKVRICGSWCQRGRKEKEETSTSRQNYSPRGNVRLP